ncbi:hypothetical protein BDK51DRAFT_34515 [Blyttiomyces helicus]|uniref:PB1 domain-containing protein n=1 Tax=Blyttiomyces helicus TaxID=388810 RepID=A0A4P9WBI7_9FUNG|nr:hypothetical protein BDK51DRAFT_34515 [Blyttiomyces helicus]|eukprot:RKO88965.1 hypothetical protein BDK51DRAFT_34515 [Blyttiomyces helicus]
MPSISRRGSYASETDSAYNTRRKLSAPQTARSGSSSRGSDRSSKVKVKIHLGEDAITILLNASASLAELTAKVQNTRRQTKRLDFAFRDEEDPGTLISIVDDEDLGLALGVGERGVVHLWCEA